MKKSFLIGIVTILLYAIMFSGCVNILGNSAVYDVANLTAVSGDIYLQFSDINQIIANKVKKFDKLDQKTILDIANKFNKIKLDIDGKSGNGKDIRSITIRFTEYLDLYHTIAFDYMTAKEILERNAAKFSDAELARLKLFDRLALDLHSQVVKLEVTIKENAEKGGVDITNAMSTTTAILKAIGTIALLI